MVLSIIMAVVGLGLVLMTYLMYRYDQSQLDQLHSRLTEQGSALSDATKANVALTDTVSHLQAQLAETLQDPVTHLMSKRSFEDRLQQTINESKRLKQSLSVLVIDIDRFKMINEVLGYELGNQVLLEVGSRILASIRQIDNVTRWSKDTFICQLPLLSRPETTALIAQRILKGLEEPIKIEGQDIYVTAGIGIAVFPQDADTVQGLIRHAEIAMSQAKQKGKQCYQFYQNKMHDNSLRELSFSSALRSDTFLNELVIRYHPIMNIEDESVFCMEAEVEWHHPVLGVMPESELLSYVEKNRQVTALYDWYLRQIASQWLTWRSIGLNPKHLSLTISVKLLEDHHFIHQLSQLFQEVTIEPKDLLLAVKETGQSLSYDVLEKSLNQLKYLGVEILMKNFGNQSLSLAYFTQWNIHYVELDQAFIADIEQDENRVIVLASVLMMLQVLSIPVIIQGVKSSVQRDFLKSLGIRYMKGQFFDQHAASGVPTEEVQDVLV